MEEDFIKDMARKYANVCSFKSNYKYDFTSIEEGYIEGFKTALRLIECKLDE